MPGSNKCFAIFQFDDERKRIFNSIVKPLVGSHTGLTYEDATSYYEPSAIKMEFIARMIEDAKFVIIDLSEKNPNVFFELGIAYNLSKPMILLISKNSFEKNWNKKMPFDIEGRELLIFDDDNELKVKLGRYISDCLYKTREITVSWVSQQKDNHIKSPTEIEIYKRGAIWSNVGIHPNFIVSYHINIHSVNVPDRNPDIRLYFSKDHNGYPRIVNIFPWEFSEMDIERYECHVDYFQTETPSGHIRLQQVSVGGKNLDRIRNFDVFVSFCWPNLVFESSFFEDRVSRLIVPKSDFRDRGYPIHLSQYIGFESINSRITIDKIRIKEVFI